MAPSVVSTLEIPPPQNERTEFEQEAIHVVESFDHFCDNYVFIHEKKSRRAIRFDRYPCQREMSELLVARKWVICVKARQLGQTWLLATYALWCLLTIPGFEACVLQQNRDYAKDFLKRVKYVFRRLPAWLQIDISSDARYEIGFDHGMGDESTLRVIAGSDTAGRSITGDLMVFDEHAYIPDAKGARDGCEPAVEISGGQIVCLSTSSGPQGDFHDTWKGAPANAYHRVFFGWQEHPKRDQKWYDTEASRHQGDKLFMGREYPSTAEEAFQHAEGRCYPSFSTKTNVQAFDQIGLLKEDAILYRGVDFGSVRPWVCLWVAHWPKSPSGLTVDPGCVETIREFMSYRFDKNFERGRERPKKVDDHAMDAIRYVVMNIHASGHIHVFRELYIEHSVAKGRTDMTDIHDMHILSGWVECDDHDKRRYKPGPNAEHFEMTLCDRSNQRTVELYSMNDLPAMMNPKPKGPAGNTEVLDGIRRINVIIDATRTIFKHVAEDPRNHRTRGLTSLERAAQAEVDNEPRMRRLHARRKRTGRRLCRVLR